MRPPLRHALAAIERVAVDSQPFVYRMPGRETLDTKTSIINLLVLRTRTHDTVCSLTRNHAGTSICFGKYSLNHPTDVFDEHCVPLLHLTMRGELRVELVGQFNLQSAS